MSTLIEPLEPRRLLSAPALLAGPAHATAAATFATPTRVRKIGPSILGTYTGDIRYSSGFHDTLTIIITEQKAVATGLYKIKGKMRQDTADLTVDIRGTFFVVDGSVNFSWKGAYSWICLCRHQ